MLETALLEMFETAGAGLSALAAHGIGLAVTDLRMSYRAPARFRDPIVGRIRLDQVGGTRIRTRGSLHRQEPDGGTTELVEGDVVLCAVENATGRPAKLPAFVRDVWQGLVTDE